MYLPVDFILEVFMKLVQTLLAFTLSGAMGSAVAVPVGPSYLNNLSGNTVSIGNSFAPLSVINDVYTFDIQPFSSVAGTAVTINLDIPQLPGQEFAITNFKIAFLDNLNNLITSDVQANPLDYTLEISANLPSAYGYQFVVTGNVTGTLGGSYGGALAAVSVPVPEAKNYGMMLAGLGLIGFVVYRRRATGIH
jgi:hypothetical protein